MLTNEPLLMFTNDMNIYHTVYEYILNYIPGKGSEL